MALVQGIKRAKSTIEIVIFRFDRREIEAALANAASRGVAVQALIAHSSRGGEKSLHDLEMRLLAAGIVVARTADDMVRYHDKLMIIDRRELYLLAFNFTYLDIERSRSFGVITTNRKLVQEAAKLFEADVKRQPYTAGSPNFIVSPVNARRQLGAYIKGARKQLLIYDPEISDPEILRLLEERARAGVEVRVLGRVSGDSARAGVQVRKLPQRLHTRTIIRDGRHAFVGSQSLRQLELDARREVGIVFRETTAVNRLFKTFHDDWELKEWKVGSEKKREATPVGNMADEVAQSVTKEQPPVAPVPETATKEIAGQTTEPSSDTEQVDEAVKGSAQAAGKEAVRDLVADTAPPSEPEPFN
jgi:phosphatidylserine/phosphatidylglycerophosphate/cardiolipin synthase-like enzyme